MRSRHSIHEEALQRIEQYSITSMRSSAHSLRSVDSIRTELSRLEAMITRSQANSNPYLNIYEGDRTTGMSVDSACHNASGVVNDQATSSNLAVKDSVHPEQLEGLQNPRDDSSSQSYYGSSTHSVRDARSRTKIDINYHPTDFQALVREQESVSKRFSELSKSHESALLYAQFSRDTSSAPGRPDKSPDSLRQSVVEERTAKRAFNPRANDARRSISNSAIPLSNPRERPVQCISNEGSCRDVPLRKSITSKSDDELFNRFDTITQNTAKPIHTDPELTCGELHSFLAAVYDPTTADYLCLQSLLNLYEHHLRLVEEEADHSLPGLRYSSVHREDLRQLHSRRLRNKLEELQLAVGVLAQKCTDLGYSLASLNDMVFSSDSQYPLRLGTRTATKIQPLTDNQARSRYASDDSSGDECYFSSAER